MNYGLKGVRYSFFVHAAVVLAILGLSSSFNPSGKPVLIDFTVEGSQSKGGPKTLSTSKKEEVKTVKPEKPKPVEKQYAVTPQKVVSHQVAATSETSPESQAPVAAGAAGNSALKTNSSSSTTTATGEGGVSTSAGTGKSHEELKQAYLKEHFAYIRNIVQKKLNYPQLARKMGWEGKVIVSFIVCLDGHAREIAITEGSGIELLDRSAVAAVQTASPFPKPPIEAKLIIPIKYTLN